MIDKLLKFDESFKNWLIKNRLKWCVILVFLGMTLGLSGVFFIDMNLRTGFLSGVGYTFLLLVTEIASGGKGIE